MRNVFVALGCAFFVKHVCLPKGVPYGPLWVYGAALVALVALAVLQWRADKRRQLRSVMSEAYDAVLKHIERTLGEPERVLSVEDAPDETVFVIPPAPERNFITLVTFGRWVHSMNVPDEYAEKYAPCAEFLLTLPPDWSYRDNPWPVNLLRLVANMPELENSWFCPGHTLSFESEESITADTEQTAVLLLSPNHIAPEAATISLPYDEKLTFLQLVLLYPEELAYLHRQSLPAIPPEFEQMPRVVDLHRPRLPLPPE